MLLRTRRLLAAFALAFVAAFPALAQEVDAHGDTDPPRVDRREPATGWSLAAGPGYSRYRVKRDADDGAEGDTAIGHGGKLTLGWQFKRWLRVELSAVSLGRDWKTDPQLAVVGVWRTGEPLAVLTSIGKFHSRTPRDDSLFFTRDTTRDESRTVTTFGVGLEWFVRPQLSLTAQAESFDGFHLFNTTRGAHMTTLAARYRF